MSNQALHSISGLNLRMSLFQVFRDHTCLKSEQTSTTPLVSQINIVERVLVVSYFSRNTLSTITSMPTGRKRSDNTRSNLTWPLRELTRLLFCKPRCNLHTGNRLSVVTLPLDRKTACQVMSCWLNLTVWFLRS